MKTRLIKIVSAILSVLLLALCCSACAAKPDVLPDEEIAALHEQYPFAQLSPEIDVNPPANINDRHLNDAAFVTVTVTGNWGDEETIPLSPGEGSAPVDVEALFLPVHIDSIIKTVNAETDFETGDRILHFATGMMCTGYEYFTPGTRFVLLISGDSRCPFTKHPGHYSAHVMNSFILTDENRLISLNEFDFLDRYTGWSLDSFSAEMNRLSWPGPLVYNSDGTVSYAS